MRVLHVLNTLDTGGAEVLVLNLAGAIDRSRFEMLACSLSTEGDLAPAMRRLGVRTFSLERQHGSVDLSLPLKLRALVREQGADVVHTHNATPWLYAAAAARAAGVALVHTEHSNLFAHQSRLMLAERLLAELSHIVISDSEAVRRKLINGQGLSPAKVVTVPNGIDTARFAAGPSRAECRRALGLAEDDLVVGTVGRLVPVKDQATLIDAFAARIAPRWPGARLAIVGDGPLRADLEGRVRAAGVPDRVLFLGRRHDVEALLPAFDLFALSSVSEGLPLTVLEAMAAGLPVVATDVGALREAVVARETGLLVSAGAAAALGDAIAELLADPGRRRALGEAGRARARERFDLAVMARRYEREYLRASGARS